MLSVGQRGGLFIWVSLSLSSWRGATGTEIFIFALGVWPKRGGSKGITRCSTTSVLWALFWIFIVTKSLCFHDVDTNKLCMTDHALNVDAEHLCILVLCSSLAAGVCGWLCPTAKELHQAFGIVWLHTTTRLWICSCSIEKLKAIYRPMCLLTLQISVSKSSTLQWSARNEVLRALLRRVCPWI